MGYFNNIGGLTSTCNYFFDSKLICCGFVVRGAIYLEHGCSLCHHLIMSSLLWRCFQGEGWFLGVESKRKEGEGAVITLVEKN